MTRYCATCGRTFTSGSHKYQNCKECRNKPKIKEKNNIDYSTSSTTTITYKPIPQQPIIVQQQPTYIPPSNFVTHPPVLPPPLLPPPHPHTINVTTYPPIQHHVYPTNYTIQPNSNIYGNIMY